jgi:competence protein ComEC
MTGMGTATFRAVVMLTIDLIGKTAGRTSDIVTSMGIAAVCICIVNPLIIRDAGFLLSFGAICGISFVAPALTERAGDIGKRKLCSNFISSISISLVTAPIILYFYYELPLYAPIINLLVLPLVPVVLIGGLLTGITGLISLSIGKIPAIPVKAVLHIYDIICKQADRLPLGNINPGHISCKNIILYYVFLSLVVTVLKYKPVGKKMKKAALLWLTVGAGTVFAIYLMVVFRNRFRAVFLYVGQGDGILISSENGSNILIDGGSSDNSSLGEYILSPAIKYYGMSKLDYVFVTHGDSDHVSGIKWLLESDYTGIKIKNIVLPRYGDMEAFEAIIELAEDKNVNIIYISAGDTLGDGSLTLDCLYPGSESEYEDTNNSSLIMLLSNGKMRFLFTGDAGEEAEKQLIASEIDLKCDILKIGHHGSRYSTSEEFLTACQPEYGIISCGIDNSYGHPHSEVIDRLKAFEVNIFRTDEDGAIVIE